ncbi:helix-turn-helix domain-containing protein [Pontibacter populi]|uniref:Helix-turn-helix domain-containing protein n=1 Tax=Pontibacter populi TaxID=890055 RepID=A0ABV1RP60_9BACT
MIDNTILLTSISAESLKAIIAEAVRENLKDIQKDATPVATESDKVLEAQEVIKLLKISPATLENWKRQSKIPFYRIGRRVYFKESEVLTSLNKAQL